MQKVDLQTSNFNPYCEKIYFVGAMVVDKQFEFNNEFGEGHYLAKTGDIILKGTCGEHWIVPISKVVGEKAKYEMNGNPINISEITRGHALDADFTTIASKESKTIIWATRITKADVQVVSPEGRVLTVNNSKYEHGEGDMICCSDNDGKPSFESGYWVVNGMVFENTYKLAEI